MLALTENAVSVIRDLTSSSEEPETSGVRIAVDSAEQQLSLSLASAAVEGDQVLEEQGARVYLQQDAATLLDDRTLDAAVDEQGGVQFMVAGSG